MQFLQQLFPAINQYNIYLIIPIFLLCYFLSVRINAKVKGRLFQSKHQHKQSICTKKINKVSEPERIFYSGFLKSAGQMLYKQGNPLGLNASNYYIVKFALSAICFILGIRNYGSAGAAVLLGIGGFYIANVYVLLNKHIRNNAIRNDLLNAVDCLYLQLSAHVSLKDALRGLHEVCRNKDLKNALIRLSARYELTEYNIEEAGDEFKNSFDILEADMFSTALKQQVVTGASLEVLDHLSGILRDSYLDKLNLNTKVKVLYITAGVAVVLFNLIALTFFPIFVSVNHNMREIFK